MHLDNLLFCFIIISIIIIFYHYGKICQQMNQFGGFYESDVEFNKEAEISLFSFYIGDFINNKYNGYLLMMDNSQESNILINEKIEFCLCHDIKHNINDVLTNNRNLKFKLNFYNLETELLPKSMYVDFYPITNKIVLYKKEDINKVYAVFYKNPVLSEIEQISKESNISNENQIDKKKDLDKKIPIEFESL